MFEFKERRRVFDAYQHVFSTQEGKVVLDDLMKTFHVLTPLSKSNSAFDEGARCVVLRILKTVSINTDKYRELMLKMFETKGDQDAN